MGQRYGELTLASISAITESAFTSSEALRTASSSKLSCRASLRSCCE